MANTYASLTLPVHHGAVYKWTYSFWVKRSSLGSNQCMVGIRYSGTYNAQIKFTTNDQLEVHDYRTSYKLQKVTNRRFRDLNSWYHIVVSNDNSVSSPDLKIYINGVEETSFATDNEYSQNGTTSFNNIYPNYIGQKGTGDYFDGYISHFHFIDGTAYTASTFGSTDSTTGEWRINTSPSVTYGDNGFFLLKDGNSLTDQSPNTNNFTLGGGTITDVKDNPSTVYATMNPLINNGTTTTYSQGNNTVSTSNAHYKVSASTLAVSTGKWYMEFKAVSGGFGSIDACVGIIQTETAFSTSSQNLNAYPNGYSYGSHGQVKQYNNSNIYTGSTYADGDIIGIALDMDNNKLYFRKNNSAWENSGDPTSGSTGTGAVSITSGKEYYFACSTITSGGTKVFSANFGNGLFGTTAITTNSGNGYAGAEGSSKFNYQPPTGYRALSTKGLNL